MNTFAQRLLAWFDQHGRKHLPWQIEPTPYRVWVSEIMLQQTQVTTVIPYYLRFMDSFPTIADLAAAPLDAVLQHWAGLGYYARARNLHKAAQHIMTQHAGLFPRDFAQVLALPGIGESTAGAILAFSTQQRFPILDGNVKRILCRHEAFTEPPAVPKHHAALWKIADRYTPHERIGAYTQAIMDLGATLCTRSKARCIECPLQDTCKAYAMQRVLDFPVKIAKPTKPVKTRFFLMIQHPEKGILLYQRPMQGIWGGLWSLPEWEAESEGNEGDAQEAVRQKIQQFCAFIMVGLDTADKPRYVGEDKPRYVGSRVSFKSLPVLIHQFTHYQLNLKPLLVQFPTKTKLKTHIQFQQHKTQWRQQKDLVHVGLPAPIKKLIDVHASSLY